MMFWKLMYICGALAVVVKAECPLSQNPKDVAECVRYLTSGLYGAVTNDLKIVCAIASDIANCVRREMGDCVAAQVGRAAMDEVRDIAENCCPDRNHPRCPIRPTILHEQRCFAADSLVTLANGQHTTIAQLQPHEPLLAYNDHTKRVVSTHFLAMLDFQPHRFALFKQLTTVTGRQLALTSSHLLPTQEHGYLMAKHIQPGMHVLTMSAEGALNAEMVSNVTEVVKLGYVAPLTSEGTLMVNGVAASCYATISSHKAAHLAVLPMRWWYAMMGASSSSSSTEGVHWFASMLYEMVASLAPSIIHH